jgi:hypothetical protein
MNRQPMANFASSKLLSAALFVLVPAGYLSMILWRPARSYGPTGREGVSPFCGVLMAAVFLVSLLSWNRHRVVASLGLVACILWLAIVLLPVV